MTPPPSRLTELRRALREAKDIDARLDNCSTTTSVVLLKLGIAYEKKQGVRLTADELYSYVLHDSAIRAAVEETAHHILGHYPGEGSQ